MKTIDSIQKELHDIQTSISIRLGGIRQLIDEIGETDIRHMDNLFYDIEELRKKENEKE